MWSLPIQQATSPPIFKGAKDMIHSDVWGLAQTATIEDANTTSPSLTTSLSTHGSFPWGRREFSQMEERNTSLMYSCHTSAKKGFDENSLADTHCNKTELWNVTCGSYTKHRILTGRRRSNGELKTQSTRERQRGNREKNQFKNNNTLSIGCAQRALLYKFIQTNRVLTRTSMLITKLLH